MIITSMMCLAINVYHEARGASVSEQQKVINVIINRSEKNKVDYCTTTFQKGQFSWTYTYKPKYKFKDYNDMLKYYNVTDLKSLTQIMSTINTTMFDRYMGDTGHGIEYYHDKSIHSFKWNKNSKSTILVYSTKDFKFYRDV